MHNNRQNIDKALLKLENITVELSNVFHLLSGAGVEMGYKQFTKSAKSLTKLIESLKKFIKK